MHHHRGIRKAVYDYRTYICHVIVIKPQPLMERENDINCGGIFEEIPKPIMCIHSNVGGIQQCMQFIIWLTCMDADFIYYYHAT